MLIQFDISEHGFFCHIDSTQNVAVHSVNHIHISRPCYQLITQSRNPPPTHTLLCHYYLPDTPYTATYILLKWGYNGLAMHLIYCMCCVAAVTRRREDEQSR